MYPFHYDLCLYSSIPFRGKSLDMRKYVHKTRLPFVICNLKGNEWSYSILDIFRCPACTQGSGWSQKQSFHIWYSPTKNARLDFVHCQPWHHFYYCLAPNPLSLWVSPQMHLVNQDVKSTTIQWQLQFHWLPLILQNVVVYEAVTFTLFPLFFSVLNCWICPCNSFLCHLIQF